ncbi:MAG: FecR family protein [Rufibacter sp.]
MAKALRGELSEEEQQAFASWLNEDEGHQELWAEASEAWEDAGLEQDLTFEPNVDMAWDTFCAKANLYTIPAVDLDVELTPTPSAQEEPKVIPLFPFQKVYKYAAAVVVAAGLGWLGYLQSSSSPEWSQVATLSGERKLVFLPDSSQVTLNENSTLRYQTAFNGSERRVELAGEGFFEVTKNPEKPFVIESGDATTTVLGTSFNVKAVPAEQEVSVAVVTGKVALASSQTGQKVLLTPGFTGRLTSAGQLTKQGTLANQASWRSLSFTGASIEDVAQQLEEYFNISFQIKNEALLNCSFTGTFADPDLQEILTVLAATNDYKITNTAPGSYSVSGAGCQ